MDDARERDKISVPADLEDFDVLLKQYVRSEAAIAAQIDRILMHGRLFSERRAQTELVQV